MTGIVSLTSDVQLTLALSGGDLTGATLPIILNDALDAIGRTAGAAFSFAGARLEEGTEFMAGGQMFRLSYTGGTGNDVVLDVIPEPGVGGLVFLRLGGLYFRCRRI